MYPALHMGLGREEPRGPCPPQKLFCCKIYSENISRYANDSAYCYMGRQSTKLSAGFSKHCVLSGGTPPLNADLFESERRNINTTSI